MPNYSLKEIAQSFKQKKRWEKQYPINYFIVRPLSFLITFFVIRLTTSPSRIAWIGFIFGLLGCYSFLGILWWTAWPGIILVSVYSLLDAVDGNIARTTKNVTYYGKFLDGLFGKIIESSYCFFIGWGLAGGLSLISNHGVYDSNQTKVQIVPLICGAVIMFGRLFSSFIDLKYEYHAFEKRGSKSTGGNSIYNEIQSSTFRENWYYQIFINFNLLNNQIILLVICELFFEISFALYLLTFYYLIRIVTYFTFFLVCARQKL